MPKVLKLVAAVVTAVIGLGVTGVLVLRDLDRRPDYCAYCHVTERGVASWIDSDYLAYKHAVSGISCQRCHERNVGTLVHEIAVTASGQARAPSPDFALASADCLRCHGGYEQLAALTTGLSRNPHDSPHGEQACSACHQVHEPSVDSCAACHEQTVFGPGWTAPARPGAMVQ